MTNAATLAMILLIFNLRVIRTSTIACNKLSLTNTNRILIGSATYVVTGDICIEQPCCRTIFQEISSDRPSATLKGSITAYSSFLSHQKTLSACFPFSVRVKWLRKHQVLSPDRVDSCSLSWAYFRDNDGVAKISKLQRTKRTIQMGRAIFKFFRD